MGLEGMKAIRIMFLSVQSTKLLSHFKTHVEGDISFIFFFIMTLAQGVTTVLPHSTLLVPSIRTDAYFFRLSCIAKGNCLPSENMHVLISFKWGLA